MKQLFTSRRSLIAASAVAACTLSGCGVGEGLYNVALPGGADLGSHPYTVTAQFADAQDLVPQSGVRVNDVAVGQVSSISLDASGKIARVKVEVNGSVKLPANAVASIQQTSLLGEKYVALAAPANTPSTGQLNAGDTIPVSRTTNGVQVEQVFGALSLLLNGGGIGQLQEIYRELNKFTSGNEDQIRGFFTSVNTVVTDLNTNRGSITRALDALDTLATSLQKDNGQIENVLNDLAPGIKVIAEQRTQLTGALTAFNRLATVTKRTLDASKDDIIADFKALKPILGQLASAGSALPRSLQVLFTYPFSNGAVEGLKGDYINAFVTLALRTKGGTTYTPTALTQRLPASGPRVLNVPTGLLPPTSSVGAGLPSTLTFSPSSSASGNGAASSPSGSSSGSGSASGSASQSGSGSSSGSSGSGSNSPTGTSSSPGGSDSASGSGSSSTSSSAAAAKNAPTTAGGDR